MDAGAGHDPPSPATSLSLDAGTLIPRGSVARRGFRMNPSNSVQPHGSQSMSRGLGILLLLAGSILLLEDSLEIEGRESSGLDVLLLLVGSGLLLDSREEGHP